MGIFVLTPFCWAYDHHNHHLTTGKIDEELNHGFSETIFHTLKEYKQTKYKNLIHIIKNPCIFFLIIPSLKFLILNRMLTLLYKYNDN